MKMAANWRVLVVVSAWCMLTCCYADDLFPLVENATWRMAPVTSYQARIEAFPPHWDNEHGAFVSGIQIPGRENMTFEERYVAALDSVTTSSVEGALMYLQRDMIDGGAAPWQVEGPGKCQRKNNASVITFYEMQIANPRGALALYQSNIFTYPEFCPFTDYSNGSCMSFADKNKSTVTPYPPECKQYYGDDQQPKTGPCVGAIAQSTDNLATYPDTVWFSYPGSCANQPYGSKTPECRKAKPSGLCAFNTTPDGVNCFYSYKILGYLKIDDLVGITKLPRKKNYYPHDGSDRLDFRRLEAEAGVGDVAGTVTTPTTTGTSSPNDNPTSGDTYKDFHEFCMDGNIEFHDSDNDTSLGLRTVQCLDFWTNPSNAGRNQNRTNVMIDLYNKLVKTANDPMIPLPTDLDSVREKNPPCYMNGGQCYNATYGCRRHSYAQVCSICVERAADCVRHTATYRFPMLDIPNYSCPASALVSNPYKEADDKFMNAAEKMSPARRYLLAVISIAIGVAML